MTVDKGLNNYGDEFRQVVSGRGIDVASQRADDLDEEAIKMVRSQRGQEEHEGQSYTFYKIRFGLTVPLKTE